MIDRSASLARRNIRRVVGARARLREPATRARKKPAGWTTRQAFLCLKDGPPGTHGPGGSTRTTPPKTRAALPRQQVQRREVLVRKSFPDLRLGRQKNKKPGGFGPTGSLNSGGRASRGKALRKQLSKICTQHIRRGCADRRCVLRGGVLLHDLSYCRPLAVGRNRWLQIFGERRLTPPSSSGNRAVAQPLQQRPASRPSARARHRTSSQVSPSTASTHPQPGLTCKPDFPMHFKAPA